MSSIKKKTKDAIKRGRDAVVRVGKVAKSAAVVGMKAGAATAVAAGALEAEKRWKESSPTIAMKRKRNRVAAVLAGAAVLGAGLAMANSRKKH
jgi:hypothetical protein